jgi:hypothetical protein
LVGAVGIENNAYRNFKDLQGRLESVKELKRNNRECKEILIGPSMAPRFFGTESPSRAVLATRKLMSVSGPNLAARMANRRLHTDTTPTELANFDDDKGHIVGEGAVPPHGHAVEDRLPHFRQWKLCRIED